MNLEGSPFIRRREVDELLGYLDDADSRGVFLLGPWGSGKTSILLMVEQDLKQQNRTAIFVSLHGLRDPGDLGTQILDAVEGSIMIDLDGERTLRTSAGSPSLREAAALLSRTVHSKPAPVLLLDALDESTYPSRIAAAVQELSLWLNGWKIVVASRLGPASDVGRFSQFRVVGIGGFTEWESAAYLRAEVPELSHEAVNRIVGQAACNPLALSLLARQVKEYGEAVWADGTSLAPLASLVGRVIDEAIATSSRPAELGDLLEQLALTGGRESVALLASRSQLREEETRSLLNEARVRALLAFDESAGTVALFHAVIRHYILANRILARKFSLADLKFGAEEAERDDLLEESYVRRRSLDVILKQGRSIVVGDRGAGKSAIFRQLASGGPLGQGRPVHVCPIANPGDLLHRIVDKEVWLDTDALRAAWLVVVAAVVASTLPSPAPKQLCRDSEYLSTALGFQGKPASRIRRVLRATGRLFGGTTLKFAVGPMNLEAKLPAGSSVRPNKASINVENFLQEADRLLREQERRVIVALDRIDETFKYDRAKQEAVVQSLLQAESRISQFQNLRLVILIRTDLFELYDIQEKNKLISRTLTLDWSEEEWLQVLVKRVLVNKPIKGLASRLTLPDGSIQTGAALRTLFPPEIEGQPIDRWLIDSVRNGNGDIPPRLAILLLHLARELSDRPDESISTLPIFSLKALEQAMTKVSDLSFSEVVNDFKVASSFVLNCRAGKLVSFSLSQVESLFDPSEGEISEQVRLLERLGFLERTVQASDTGVTSLFRIPRLYTRCWDYA
jgi:hypothetical protein